MLAFLFIVLLIACLYLTYNFSNKMSSQRRRIILLEKMNTNLKDKINTQLKPTNETIIIKYSTPDFTSASVIEKCHLHIAPIENSLILCTLEKDTPVQVQDSAKILNTLWYEVSLETEDRINSKGWIKESFLYCNLDVVQKN